MTFRDLLYFRPRPYKYDRRVFLIQTSSGTSLPSFSNNVFKTRHCCRHATTPTSMIMSALPPKLNWFNIRSTTGRRDSKCSGSARGNQEEENGETCPISADGHHFVRDGPSYIKGVRRFNVQHPTLACKQTSCAPLFLAALLAWPSGSLGIPVLPALRPLSRGDICPQPMVLHHSSLAGSVISLVPKAFINVCHNRCTSCPPC